MEGLDAQRPKPLLAELLRLLESRPAACVCLTWRLQRPNDHPAPVAFAFFAEGGGVATVEHHRMPYQFPSVNRRFNADFGIALGDPARLLAIRRLVMATWGMRPCAIRSRALGRRRA